MVEEYKRYDIVLVKLNPTVGSEIQKTRPCIIISPDEINMSKTYNSSSNDKQRHSISYLDQK